ncbi:MAG: hypothetical protein O3B31_10075 [Chloroflexi bacterium]|nr:hypothetical protein [Chloroflexota bacterium]MDA1003674.1 hypothetical protein [Chloroflexota bacterium]
MKHASFDPSCGICRGNADAQALPAGPLVFENRLWQVRRLPAGIGVPGWMMLNAQRHVPGPAHLDDAEAANFGPALRHFELTLERVTGALRIYTAAMGESFPHLHVHMVPRYETMPNDASAWGVFELYGATQRGEVAVDEAEATRIASAYRDALAASPPPL